MFKDEIKKITLPQLEVPKLKGHTKIELTDVHTGKKEVIEHDNTFQPEFIAAYMRSLGIFNNNPFANDTWRTRSMVKNLVGGIMLFRDAITEGAHYMPAGNKMVANGAMDISNGDTPVELGTYNAIESVIGTNSASLVYDWNTAQGNGEIGCICLSSYYGGLIGYGNASGNARATLVYMDADQSFKELGYGYTNVVYGNKRYVFTLNTNAKTLTVDKYNMAITKVSVFDGVKVETLTKTYTETLNTSACVYKPCGDKLLIVPSIFEISNNQTLHFLIYDFETDTLTEGKFINTTGNYVSIETYDYEADNIGLIGSYIYLFNIRYSRNLTSNQLLKVDYTSGAIVDTITTTKARKNIDDNLSGTMTQLTPDLYYYLGDSGEMIIYDPVNGTTFPANAYGQMLSYGYSRRSRGYYNQSIDAFSTYQTANNSNSNIKTLWKNPLYLATINNLDTPVLKTASKTMKVTYTLTEAS